MMIRSTATAVLERAATIRDGFTTEPYELPWASEARFFVQTFSLSGVNAVLGFKTQISPDGLHWCGLDDDLHRVDAPGLTTWSVAAFGQWLRLLVLTDVEGAEARARIYLVGKS